MANIAIPGTSSFVGEFFLLMGIFKANTSAAFFGATGMVLGGGYSLWLFNRIVYGNLKIQYISSFEDISLREFCVFFLLKSELNYFKSINLDLKYWNWL